MTVGLIVLALVVGHFILCLCFKKGLFWWLKIKFCGDEGMNYKKMEDDHIQLGSEPVRNDLNAPVYGTVTV